MSLGSADERLALRHLIADFWVFGLAVAFILFLHGYYLTTALVGLLWRSAKTWTYPIITPALFVFHTHVVFMHAGSDFTPEARAMEFPFELAGAGIVFFCALIGSSVLKRWTNSRSDMNAYLDALGITILAFILVNTANFLRPVVGSSAFRTYGLPLTFYREGGFIKEWIWQPGAVVWPGIVADVAVIAAVVLLLGRGWQTIRGK